MAARIMTLRGSVTKTGVMEKTCTVTVPRQVVHPKLLKEMTRHKKYLVHDEHNTATLGDRVEIQLGRPLSARKRFFLKQILQGSIASSSSPSSSNSTTSSSSTSSTNSSPSPVNSSVQTHAPTTPFEDVKILESALPNASVEEMKARRREERRRSEREAAERLGVEV